MVNMDVLISNPENTSTPKEKLFEISDGEMSREDSKGSLSRYKMNSYLSDSSNPSNKANLIFTLKEKVGALAETLSIFKNRNVNLLHIESRPSKRTDGCYEFLVECEPQDGELNKVIGLLKQHADDVIVHSWDPETKYEYEVPWFPKRIKDLDEFANRVLSYGSELDSDHPGFTDQIYRARRKQFADIAINYRHGQIIPRIDYTEEEVNTWATIFKELVKLFPTHACREFNYVFPLLQQNCGYKENHIPALQDVSDFLKDCTGFILRPVAGLLSSRDFLAGLAFRVFHSTQYIRHSSCPHYTPEPDICHEILGHVPLFADPDFAQFSQDIGLASLGAPDDWIQKLATLYWFTVEFGLCLQNGQRKAYGAGLLSSFGELQYCLSDEPVVEPFEPLKTAIQEYPITRYQPKYFLANSFQDARDKLAEYSAMIPRPFSVRYNSFTQSIDILDNKNLVAKMAHDLRNDLATLEDAIKKLK